ncbi:MAG: preprotein translocase subunit SecE [Bdellovibrionales bacterium]
MDKATTNKIMTFTFLLGAALVFWTVGVLFETASDSFAVMANLKAQPVIRHGFPLLCGLGMFAWLQLSAKNRAFADEVITETSKVVWPTFRDVKGMTVAVTIMLIISGIIIAGFDLGAGKTLKLILGM